MKENKQPIFKSIFGSSWNKLPIVMQKHYANRPYSNDVVTVKGKMDIEFNWFGKLCAPLFRIFGTLIPYQGKNIETTVHYKSSKIDNSLINQRLGGSIASVIYCLDKGVDIFRVHDVYETQQAIKIYNKIKCIK